MRQVLQKNRLSLFALVCLAGCMGDKAPPMNTNLDTIYKASVKFADTSHMVEMRGGLLSSQEDAALSAFLNMNSVTYADRISLEAADAASMNKSKTAIDAVLSRVGLTVSNTTLTSGFKPGEVRVVVTHSSVVMPECGHFERAASPNWQNQTSSNFGCATRSNLAAMVANPADLVIGTPLGSPNAALVAKPVETWNSLGQTGISGGRPWTGTGPDPSSKPTQGQLNVGGGKTGGAGSGG